MSVTVMAVIPARMASRRFPGKPLLRVAGLPMVEHVRRRALRCPGFCKVVVATCDPEIAETITGYGGQCIMTSPSHQAATDRVSEAAQQLDCTHVVNLQGDEILALPADVEKMLRAITAEPSVPAWNAVARIEEAEELRDPSVVKCACSASGRILFCSRDFSSLIGRLDGRNEPLRRVLGILGYRRDFLERYSTLARTPLEQAEAIDQSRILEHDVMLRSVEFSRGYPGINEPREIMLVERYLQQDAVQQAVLEQITKP